MAETETAYAAGFFDGEGCISLTRIRAKYNRLAVTDQFRLVVCVVICNKDIVDWMQKKFGGKITLRRMSKYSPNYNDAYQWKVNFAEAANFLRTVRPYLKIKADEADLALEFIALQSTIRYKSPVPPDVQAIRESFHQRMRDLKPASKARRANQQSRWTGMTG